MNILIGFNTFGSYKRQNIAVESYKHLATLFPNVVSLLDVQFKDEKNTFSSPYGIDVQFSLDRSSLDVTTGGTKKLPFVNDIINALAEKNCDYFIFTNSDVIINKNLIDYILAKKPECMACSRLDIADIDSFESLKTQIAPVRWEIGGFDTFVFKRGWYEIHKHLFHDYLLGKPYFDHVYAGLMQCYGDGTPLGNQYPPYCFHIHHGIGSVLQDCPERDFNKGTFENNQLDKFMSKVIHFNLQYNLMRRKPFGSFLYYDPNEIQFQTLVFKNFNLYGDNKNELKTNFIFDFKE